ncbi:MAG: cardiolipin synthase [Limnochordia bacterium]
MKKVLSFMFHRVVLTGAALAVQVAALIIMINRFSSYFSLFYGITAVASIGAVLAIANGRGNSGYKIAWIIVIMSFPIFGGLFYLMFGGSRMGGWLRRRMDSMQQQQASLLTPNEELLTELEAENPDAARQAHYIQRYAYSPPYRGTYTKYLPIGEEKFAAMVEELRKAERYIFLEYFIVEEGIMWNTILDILKDKAQAGVDVRMIYDDVGSILTLPYRYDRTLEKMGIKCCRFNPFIPVLSARLNNRNHRKIAVIDGHTAFTGGINLADEYINAYEKHGHWKDSAIMVKGPAAWSLTVMFLTMWNYLRKTTEDLAEYRPTTFPSIPPSPGVVQPFSDNPLDENPVGETVYLNMIGRAKRYIYINTPYLILDSAMQTALCTAAQSGVDVRIITPHVPDKWYVHTVTRSYYPVLMESGIKIYEYTPGFMHCKTFAVDDTYGVVGTINLDYRSLYQHFECGVWLYNTDSVLQIKEDFLKTLEVCHEFDLAAYRARSPLRRAGTAILRLFAPLM